MFDHLNEIPDVGIESDLHHRDRHCEGHDKNNIKKQIIKWQKTHRSGVHLCVVQNVINKSKTSYRKSSTLCYWEAWHACYGHAARRVGFLRSCLPAWEKASWGRGERNGEQEGKTNNKHRSKTLREYKLSSIFIDTYDEWWWFFICQTLPSIYNLNTEYKIPNSGTYNVWY